MGGLEFPGLAQWLTALGGPGVIIGYLLWDRSGLQKDVKELREKIDSIRLEHLNDIKKYSTDTASSLASATDVIRANTAGSDRVSAVTGRLSEAITAIGMRLETVQDTVEKLGAR